jgi:hypothetical protein
MKRFLPAVGFALVVAGGACSPASAADQNSRSHGQNTRLALVCDQHCACWQTRYQLRKDGRDDREFWSFNTCPGGGSYNGYYRTGPSVGLGFESRFPEHSHPFPF